VLGVHEHPDDPSVGAVRGHHLTVWWRCRGGQQRVQGPEPAGLRHEQLLGRGHTGRRQRKMAVPGNSAPRSGLHCPHSRS